MIIAGIVVIHGPCTEMLQAIIPAVNNCPLNIRFPVSVSITKKDNKL